jgi:hypothetical protein
MKNIIIIFTLFISQSLFAGDLFEKNQPIPFNLGDPLELNATIGGYPIWQGENKWRLFEITRKDSIGDAAIPMGNVRAFQTENRKLVATMLVSVNLSESSMNNWVDDPCKRDDMLFKESIGGKFSDINCITINHIANYLNNPGGQSAKLYALWKEQGIDVPPTVLQITLTRYASKGRWLAITLNINPELAGFQRSNERAWGRDPWHFTQSFNDPTKKKFIDSLGAWAVKFAKQMDIAFGYDKKKDAFMSIPSWRSVIEAQPKIEAVKPKVTLD